MSLSSLCPEAQQMVSDRNIDLTTDAIIRLSAMEPRRQTGWIHSPIIAMCIDRVLANPGTGNNVVSDQVPTVTTNETQASLKPPAKIPDPDPESDDEPIPFTLFD